MNEVGITDVDPNILLCMSIGKRKRQSKVKVKVKVKVIVEAEADGGVRKVTARVTQAKKHERE